MTTSRLAVPKQEGWQAGSEVFTQEVELQRGCFTLSIWQISQICKTSAGGRHIHPWPRTSSFRNIIIICFLLPLLLLSMGPFPSISSRFLSFFSSILQTSLGLLSLHVLQYCWRLSKWVWSYSRLRSYQRWLRGSPHTWAMVWALPGIGSTQPFHYFLS